MLIAWISTSSAQQRLALALAGPGANPLPPPPLRLLPHTLPPPLHPAALSPAAATSIGRAIGFPARLDPKALAHALEQTVTDLPFLAGRFGGLKKLRLDSLAIRHTGEGVPLTVVHAEGVYTCCATRSWLAPACALLAHCYLLQVAVSHVIGHPTLTSKATEPCALHHQLLLPCHGMPAGATLAALAPEHWPRSGVTIAQPAWPWYLERMDVGKKWVLSDGEGGRQGGRHAATSCWAVGSTAPCGQQPS